MTQDDPTATDARTPKEAPDTTENNPPARARRPTIVDVATLAQVSVGTVSNVLTNARRVRPHTRRRVEVAITELGFRPNRVAQSLSRKRTHLIGALVPEVANPFFSEFVQGVEQALGVEQYAVLFGTSHESIEAERRYLDSFRERRVDGVIIVVVSDTDVGELSQLAAETPVVVADRTVPGWAGDAVLGDNEEGVELAVEHLVQLGHRRIALINGEPKLSTARERGLGFEHALERRGLEPVQISQGSFTLESGRAQTEQLLSLDEPPTAIVAGNDLLAMSAVAAASEQGLRVPDDLSVIGYDDIIYARLVSPSLTTVRQSAYAMGGQAVRLLIDQLRAQHPKSQRIVFRPEFVVRRSTAIVPASSARRFHR